MRILCLNRGSSSLKWAAFDDDVRATGGTARAEGGALDVRAALETALAAGPFAVVAHRFVHGGPRHHAPALVDDALLAGVRAATPFAPLHLPDELALVDELAARAPGLPQVLCFDTHFHWELPEVARRLALPRDLYDEGVRRYGFHGLSYESIVAATDGAPGRTVIAHLGAGASLAAVRDGRSVDTTMGMTPTGGVMSATRTGDLDPGVLLYLVAQHRLDGAGLERLVDRASGLLGVSGLSSDLRALEASAAPAAGLAIEMFCYQVRQRVGALAVSLGGLDRLVFTGGIGEHAASVRARVCDGLAPLGVLLDEAKNAAHARAIGRGACAVLVLPADEEGVMARHARRLLAPR